MLTGALDNCPNPPSLSDRVCLTVHAQFLAEGVPIDLLCSSLKKSNSVIKEMKAIGVESEIKTTDFESIKDNDMPMPRNPQGTQGVTYDMYHR